MANLLYILLLCAAASLDALTAGAAYGLKRIHIAVDALVILCAVTVVNTGAGLVGADLLRRFIGPHAATIAGAVLLVALGTFRLLLEYLTEGPASSGPRSGANGRRLTISLGRLVLTVMVRPEVADLDKSKDISPLEAALLGTALSVDNVMATSAASLGGFAPMYMPLAMGVIQTALFAAGYYGSAVWIPERARRWLPYVAGTLLVVLGIVRLA